MRRKFSVGQVVGSDSYFVFDEESGFIVRFGMKIADAMSLSEVLRAEVVREIKPKGFTAENIEALVYEPYPRKLGKKSGIDYLLRTLKNKEDLELCASAAREYAARCIQHGTEEQFIKHFSTWVKKWRDDLPGSGAAHVVIDTDEPTFL